MGVTADTVRHYTKLGILEPKKDPRNGYKLYAEADQSRLRFALRARQLGFSVEEIQQIAQHAGRGLSPCPLVRKLVEARLAELSECLQEAQQLYQRLENALEQWRQLPDGEPDGDTIYTFIESWSDPRTLEFTSAKTSICKQSLENIEEHEQR